MKKRIDPRMHSAEHILNQTMVRLYDCGRCINAHIEKKKSKCDYHFTRSLEDAEIHEIEKRVNAVIQADMPVREEYMTQSDALKRYNLERLPEDAGDKIRIVSIGDYDSCPCIGPHVDATKEIGEFSIISAGFQQGVLRLRYRVKNRGIINPSADCQKDSIMIKNPHEDQG